MTNTILVSALILMGVLNLALTLRVVLSQALTKVQKALQCLIVWLFPIVGLVVVFLVHMGDAEPRVRSIPAPGDGSDPMPGGTQ